MVGHNIQSGDAQNGFQHSLSRITMDFHHVLNTLLLLYFKFVKARVLNRPTGQVSEVGPLGQSKWMSETGLE